MARTTELRVSVSAEIKKNRLAKLLAPLLRVLLRVCTQSVMVTTKHVR